MTSTTGHFHFAVEWSASDQEYVATCAEFPSLSFLAQSPTSALTGMEALAIQTVRDLEKEKEDYERGDSSSLATWKKEYEYARSGLSFATAQIDSLVEEKAILKGERDAALATLGVVQKVLDAKCDEATRYQQRNSELAAAIGEHHRKTINHQMCWENDEELWQALGIESKFPADTVPNWCEFMTKCAEYRASREPKKD